jgi:hypothetical protein
MALAQALVRNKHLKRLDMEQHHMESEGALAMSAMLRVNRSLTSLNMRSDVALYPTTTFGCEASEHLATTLRVHNQTYALSFYLYIYVIISSLEAQGKCAQLSWNDS